MAGATPATSPLSRLAWPGADLGDAMHALAAHTGLAPPTAAPTRPAGVPDGPWLDALAGALGVEVEPVTVDFAAVDGLLAGGGPALIRCAEGAFALVSARGGAVTLLAPDRRLRRVRRAALAGLLRRRVLEMGAPGMAGLLDRIGLDGRRRRRAEASLVSAAFRASPLGEAWLLRAPPDAPLWRQARDGGLPWQAAVFVAAHLTHLLLGLVGWYLVGDGALDGRLAPAAIGAWVLMLLTMVPLSLRAQWARARLSVGVGVLLKKRLLSGALRIDPDEMRAKGAGALMGQVFEADAIEANALGLAFGSVMAVVDLILAGVILSLGAGGAAHVLALGIFAAAVVALSVVHFGRQSRWTTARLALVDDLVARMVGHRTRLMQSTDLHGEEDRALSAYLADARRLDAMAVPLGLLGRAWLAVGIAALGPAFVGGASTGSIAVAVGGVLLAGGALATLGMGLDRIGRALIAWRVVGPLFRAGRRGQPAGDPTVVARPPARRDAAGALLLDGQGLGYRYRPDGPAVLDGCAVQIRRGDRLLVQGPSGGGKSTLAAVLTGLRAPQSGLVLLDGYDHRTLGPSGWRRRIAAAPQFHDNHVFGGTLAFNLLLGRAWPPGPDDLRAAEETCRALGLGPLIDRMPAGLQQQVGETGWQLSHGERSRVFLARALLQRSDLVVLDESFGALDPLTVDACLRCALEQAPSLMVIAHP